MTTRPTPTTTTNTAATAPHPGSAAGTSETSLRAAPAEPCTTSPAAAVTSRSPATLAFPLPELDAPAVTPHQPAASYKLAFGDASRWYCSRDGGQTIAPTASNAIAGGVIDLALQISPAHYRAGDDYRLRLAFVDSSGELSELNLNVISAGPDGTASITSPARSLTGALLTISETEDDMRAFSAGARFSIRKGQGRGVFIETDIAVCGRWLAMSGALPTLRVAKDPENFCLQIHAIKRRFRSCSLMFGGPAVVDFSKADLAAASSSPKTADA